MTTTQNVITQAALELFTLHGFDAVSMSQIAALAKKNKATIYHYYASKEVLYNTVLTEVLERFYASLSIKSSHPALLKIKSYIESLLDIDLPIIRLISRQQIDGTDHIDEANLKKINELHTTLESIYKEAIINNSVRLIDPRILFEIVLGSVLQFRFSSLSIKRNRVIFIEELYAFIIGYCSK